MKIKLLLSVTLLSLIISSAEAKQIIDIDLSKQRLTLIDNKKTILSTMVSTGNKNHPTPTGSYHIFQKQKYHKSSSYPVYKNGTRGGAKMNYMLKFLPNIAIHEGDVAFENNRSIPVSHGCIRVGSNDIKKIFKRVKNGTLVKIHGRENFNNKFNKILNSNDLLEIKSKIRNIYTAKSPLNISISQYAINNFIETNASDDDILFSLIGKLHIKTQLNIIMSKEDLN